MISQIAAVGSGRQSTISKEKRRETFAALASSSMKGLKGLRSITIAGGLGCRIDFREIFSLMLAGTMMIDRGGAGAVSGGHGVVGIPLIAQNQHQAAILLAHLDK